MKDRLWGLARLLIILVGVGILVYPSVSEYLSEKNSSVAVSTYDDSIRRMEQARIEELRAQAEAYNQRLAESNGFSKPALDEYNNPITPEDYWDILDVDGNGMMGYISIPRINVTIPVYHGTSEEVLQVAVVICRTPLCLWAGKTPMPYYPGIGVCRQRRCSRI